MSSNYNTFILPKKITRRAPLTDDEHAKHQEEVKKMAELFKEMKKKAAEDVPALPVGTLQCPECPLSFSRSGSLRVHMLDFHKKRLPAGKAGRPSTGGRKAASKRAYEKLKAKNAKEDVVKTDSQKKKSAYDAQRYQLRKLAKDRKILAQVLKKHTMEFLQFHLSLRGSTYELLKMTKEFGANYYEKIQESMTRIFVGIESFDSLHNRLCLIEIILDELVATLPELLSDKYKKNEVLSFLGACDENSLDGEKDTEMRSKIELYWKAKDGKKEKVMAMAEVLNFLHYSFAKYDFDGSRIGNSLPFVYSLFKGPWV